MSAFSLRRILAVLALAGFVGAGLSQFPAFEAPIAGESAEIETLQPPSIPLVTPIDDQVLTLAYTPDGKKLVTAGARFQLPGQITVWEVASKKKLYSLRSARGIRGIAISPDGKTLAAGEFGGVARLRDMDTGEEKAAFKGHVTGVNALAFSADGNRLVTAGLDKKVVLWDVKEQKQLQTFLGHTDMIFSVALFRHGKGFVTAGQDKTIKIWDIETGKEKLTLSGHAGAVEVVAVSPDDKVIASGSWDQTIKLWDAESGKEIGAMDVGDGHVLGIAFSPPDGKLLAASTMNGGVHLWDVATRKPVASLGRHAAPAWAVAFAPDGKSFATGSTDKTAKVWDVAERKETAILDTSAPVLKPVQALAYAPDGKTFALATDDHSAQLRDADSGEVVFTLAGHTQRITSVCFSPDGGHVATGSLDKTIKIWDRATGKEERTLTGHEGSIHTLAFAPAPEALLKDAMRGEWLLASAGDDKVIRFWASDGKEVAKFEGHPATVRVIAFARDGRHLASGGADPFVRIWDVAKRAEVTKLTGHQGMIASLAFAVDGTLASGSFDGSVRIWDPETSKERLILKRHAGPVLSLAFLPSGRRLVSGGLDSSLYVWDVASGNSTGPFRGHKGPVTGIAVDPRGQDVLSASQDMSVQRWTGGVAHPPPLTIPGNPKGSWFATYSPGGDWMASGGLGGTVDIWSRSIKPAAYPFASRAGTFWDVAYSPDGETLALGTSVGVQVCDTATGAIRRFLPMPKLVRSVAFSPDGKYLAATTGSWKDPDSPNECKVWDLGTGQELVTLEGHRGVIFRAVFAPDGKTLATSSKNKIVRIWDFPSGKLRGEIKDHQGPAKGMVFLPEGTLVTACWDKLIRFYDVTTMKLTKSWKTNSAWASLEVSPGGTMLVTADGAADAAGPGRITVWDVGEGKEIAELTGHAGRILGVAFTRDGRGVLSSGGKLDSHGEINYWDLATGKLRASLRTPKQWIENLVVSRDGKRVVAAATVGVYNFDLDFIHKERTWLAHTAFTSCGIFLDSHTLATGSWDTTIGLWDVRTGERLAVLKGHNAGIRALAATSDGKTLFSGGDDKTVKRWELPGGKLLASYSEHSNVVYALAIAPDGKTLASGAGDHRQAIPGELFLRDVETGKPRKVLDGIERNVWSLAYSPDGAWLAAGIDGGSIKIWDARTDQLRASFPVFSVRPVSFSPDSKLLVAGVGKAASALEPGNGILRLWDVPSWRERAVLRQHSHVVFSAEFSPDGNSLVSASQDGTIKLWPLPGMRGGVPATSSKATNWKPAPPPVIAAKNAPPKNVEPKKTTVILEDAKAVEPAPPKSMGGHVWLALAIVSFLGVALGLALMRHRREAPVEVGEDDVIIEEEAPEAEDTPSDPEPAPRFIPLLCASCGKRLKARPERAGKTLRCPECGEGVPVPAKKRTSMRLVGDHANHAVKRRPRNQG